MFKTHRGLSPDILREMPKISSYNLRRNNTFERRQVPCVYHGLKLLSFVGPKIRDLESLKVFKLKIKNRLALNELADCVELLYNKLCFFKAVRLTIIIVFIICYHLRCL